MVLGGCNLWALEGGGGWRRSQVAIGTFISGDIDSFIVGGACKFSTDFLISGRFSVCFWSS